MDRYNAKITFINRLNITLNWDPKPSLIDTIKLRLMGREKFVEMIRQAFAPGLETLRRELEVQAIQELKMLIESRGDH